MRRTFTTFVALALTTALGVLAAPRPASAQDLETPRARQGYYVTLGIYGVVTQAREKGNWLGPWPGGGGALRVGQLVTRRLGIGLSLESGAAAGGGQRASFTAMGLEASWALWGNLAARGGFGVGFLGLHDPRDPNESSTRGAAGTWYALGVGYDWFPGRKRRTGGFSIAPTVQARFVPGGDTDGLVAFFGFDLGYWTGLPPNQLELPPSEAWPAARPASAR